MSLIIKWLADITEVTDIMEVTDGMAKNQGRGQEGGEKLGLGTSSSQAQYVR